MIEVIRGHDTTRRHHKLSAIKGRNVALDAELMATVAAIIEDVRRHGDAALVDYTARFDGVRLRREDLRVDEAALRESAARTDGRVHEALREAIKRVRDFHERERVESWEIEGARGVRLGQRITPIESAGLYVPGGTASYPSSVVMNVVPAQVAGVGRLAVVTPPRTLAETPAVAAALLELGITEIYQVGGAQAVAALAYGTETIPRVHKITGPGNKYVAAAKKLVFGAVGIDSIAGPSEVVVLADETARADYVAADLTGNPRATLVLNTDGTVPAPDASFDAVVSTQVLEHVEDPGSYLSECFRVLRPGGRMLLSTHGVFVYHPDPDDYWRWTLAGLQKAVGDAGFEIVRFEGILGGLPTGLQMVQDSIYWHIPTLLRAPFALVMQTLIRLTDRLYDDHSRTLDAQVYALVAEKP